MMSALSLANQETAYAHQKSDRGQSYVSFDVSQNPLISWFIVVL
jgi:hypothetical protein